jgi:hypothetical protein
LARVGVRWECVGTLLTRNRLGKERPHVLIKAKPIQNMRFPYFKGEMREVHVKDAWGMGYVR